MTNSTMSAQPKDRSESSRGASTARGRRPEPSVRDADLDATIADYTSGTYTRTPCADVDAHGVQVDGLRLYLARVDAGLTREQLEDRLLDAGVICTARDIAQWERDAAPLTVNALAEIMDILRVRLSAVVLCWTCIRGVRFDERTTEHHAWVLDVAPLVARRRELGLSTYEVARRGKIRRRSVALLERGKAACVDVNELAQYLEVLRLEDEPIDRYFHRAAVAPASPSVEGSQA